MRRIAQGAVLMDAGVAPEIETGRRATASRRRRAGNAIRLPAPQSAYRQRDRLTGTAIGSPEVI